MAAPRLAWLILALALVTAPVLRVAGISAKSILATDEGYSYIYATGHGCDYYDAVLAEQYPIGAWVQASEWKKFMRFDEPFCFGETAHALIRFDLHPPLFFWVLHLWSWITGVHSWTGPALNILFVAVATLCLYGLARYVLGEPLEAAVVACAWALSPAVFQASFEARHYDLLALVTILFVWQILRYSDPKQKPRRVDFILLVAATAAGALTHYYFAIVVAGAGLYSIVRLFNKDRKRLMAEFSAIILGYAAFFWFHPKFYQSFINERKEIGVFSYEDLLARVGSVFATFKQFFFMPVSFRYALLGLLFGWLILAFRAKRWMPFGRLRDIDFNGIHVLYFFLWPAGVQIALYLAYLSPHHAVLPKYFSMAWPFFAFIAVFILRFFKPYKISPTIFFCLFMLASAAQGLSTFNDFAKSKPNPSAFLKSAPAVIVDNASMAVLPRIMWELPDDKRVFVAFRDHLLNHREAWLSHLDSNAVYISIDSPLLRRGDAQDGKEEILALMNQAYEMEPIKGGAWGLGEVIRIRRKL